MHPSIRHFLIGFSALLYLMLCSTAFAVNKKTDLIYLKNGDRITGEIKSLDQGQLLLKTDALGNVMIKWEDINYINSDKWLQVELTDGSRFFGQAPEPESNTDNLILQTSRGPVSLDPNQVVKIEAININETFWQRLDGSLKLGFNFSKASDVTQLNLNANAGYRTRKYLANVALNTNLTRNGEGTDTTRGDLTGTYFRFRPNRWFWVGSLSAQTNEELGIEFRALGSGGIGRFLFQTPRSNLATSLGLAANLEKTITDSDTTDNDNEASWEGVIGIEWNFYKLYSPKASWRLSANAYPGITETNRNRGNLDLNFSQEFWKDLFWDLSFYYSYDSKPPTGALSKEDFGIVTSIGYSF